MAAERWTQAVPRQLLRVRLSDAPPNRPPRWTCNLQVRIDGGAFRGARPTVVAG
jgi:hypothetical protein